jgi:DNA-binding transcriptional MerR regulator
MNKGLYFRRLEMLSKGIHLEYTSLHLASIVLQLKIMQVGFTPRQVTRITGVPYSTLNLWAKNGLLGPSIASAEGSRSERIYSFTDLVALKIVLELRKAGVTTQSLKKVIDFLRSKEGCGVPFAEARLVVSGRDVILVKSKSELVSALQSPGQSCLSFVVDLPHTLGELAQLTEANANFAVGVLQGPTSLSRKQPARAKSNSHRRSLP